MRFAKYHALGNDYLVIEESAETPLDPSVVRRICDRHRGIGSDGILERLAPGGAVAHRVRIWNPDGTEAEKSGNGLRIFARYLWDRDLVDDRPFSVSTAAGPVNCTVEAEGRSVTVEMGRVSFDSADIPVTGPRREVLRETLLVAGQSLEFSAATIGNPHCVILREHAFGEEARTLGPVIEVDEHFPNRTNVQFLEIVDRRNLRIEIWERGAGYTLASGSSSSAAAAVAHKLGLVDRNISVHMPGGIIKIEIGDDFAIKMTGSVTRVGDGVISPEIFSV